MTLNRVRTASAALLIAGIVGCSNISTPQIVETTADQQIAEQLYGDYRDRAPEDEVIYFVLPDRFENGDASNDRGGVEGGYLDHGFRPDHRGFYLGGDLKGLTDRLDYIQGLGATAIWLGPIYKNKPVQGGPGQETSGYHGYWITDFTTVDPHFGTEEDLKAFVEAAHARDMKVYLDIITNHTADVIALRECHDPDFENRIEEPGCPYRSKGDYPFTRRGGLEGEPINEGFLGDSAEHQTAENFARLTEPDFAYTPFVSEDEKDIKRPAWLNDISLYHNRGDSEWYGESSLYGDFAGLDDLATENPRVVDGFVEIYKDWITKYRIDGFRIDTAKHVNPEFWAVFNPAMVEHAASIGIPNFYVFGEAYETEISALAGHTRGGGFDQVLDFAFQFAFKAVLADGEPTSRLDTLFQADRLFGGGVETSHARPVFTGNHDMGRMSGFIREDYPEASDEEMLKRIKLAHAAMYFLRGVPVVYYGDEQGFVSDGNDQKARETMFPGLVEEYNDNDLAGTDATTAEENFDASHPLYLALKTYAGIRADHPALRYGEQKILHSDEDGGVFVVSRSLGDTEYVIAMNFRAEPRALNVEVGPELRSFTALAGECAPGVSAPGSYPLALGGLEFAVCKSGRATE